MALVYRPAGYTGTLQQLTWAQGNNVSATAYLWGGGGGGGGNDTGIGGSGSGGQYSQVNFVVSEGDVLELAVGGPGQGGASYSGNAAGGSPADCRAAGIRVAHCRGGDYFAGADEQTRGQC